MWWQPDDGRVCDNRARLPVGGDGHCEWATTGACHPGVGPHCNVPYKLFYREISEVIGVRHEFAGRGNACFDSCLVMGITTLWAVGYLVNLLKLALGIGALFWWRMAGAVLFPFGGILGYF